MLKPFSPRHDCPLVVELLKPLGNPEFVPLEERLASKEMLVASMLDQDIYLIHEYYDGPEEQDWPED